MQNKYQDKFGYPVPRSAGKVKPRMAQWIQDFIKHSPFCVLATSNAAGDCDASPKGGKPGFVKVLSDKQLFIPDVAGNKLFHGYGNIESNPRVGLVFFIPGHNSTVRVNGKVRAIDGAELSGVKLEVHDPDEKAEVLQGLLLDVEESYSHCPRALKFSKLWDVNEISKNITDPPLPPKEPGI
jgi:predicted pyridoxine 5'-phosphate oxidase superfamily flavin-nucleotide-binding protein